LKGEDRRRIIPAMSETPAIHSEEEVMFFDTDCGGVVHNIAYLRFVETARTRLGARLGLDARAMAERNEYAVVLRTEIDYRRPAKLGDILQIDGELETVQRVRFWCSFRIVRPADDVLLVTCRQQLALVGTPHGAPLRLPSNWSEDYAHLIESPSSKGK